MNFLLNILFWCEKCQKTVEGKATDGNLMTQQFIACEFCGKMLAISGVKL